MPYADPWGNFVPDPLFELHTPTDELRCHLAQTCNNGFYKNFPTDCWPYDVSAAPLGPGQPWREFILMVHHDYDTTQTMAKLHKLLGPEVYITEHNFIELEECE
jgi:hypothetical protein